MLFRLVWPSPEEVAGTEKESQLVCKQRHENKTREKKNLNLYFVIHSPFPSTLSLSLRGTTHFAMFLTSLATYPLVPRRLFTSLSTLHMKSKRPPSNGVGVEKSSELTDLHLPYVTFASVIEARREEAKRTMVVQVIAEAGKNHRKNLS